MEYNIYISYLYDIYGNLLTDKQKEYFEDYYFNNLTLSEISENNNISRNAVHKNIKDTISKLEYYEYNLKIYEKKCEMKRLIENYKENKEKILELLE